MSKRKLIVGVMGPGNDCPEPIAAAAHQLGKLIAEQGWHLLTGGRDTGVMNAASKGAKEAGGLVIGILPGKDSSVSDAVDIAIVTELGSARNNINVLTSDFVVSCGMGTGTSSEVSLALKAGKSVMMLHAGNSSIAFYKELAPKLVRTAETPEDVVKLILESLNVSR
jgi:uncharacterized protein (TIGR00725 family)